MQIELQPLTPTQGTHWQVRLNEHFITFRSEVEARHFVDRLEARLTAPHALPEDVESAREEGSV